MNKIFRTVWNRVRRQLVAVNESVTGASQASGSTVRGSVVNAQPVNTVGVTLKKSALALAVGSALALSLPAANASWIDDNGGVDGKLTWTVSSPSNPSAWNALTKQSVVINSGEALDVIASGSTYLPANTTVPDLLSAATMVNNGTVSATWIGNEVQSHAEIDSLWLDNAGTFSVTMQNATPTPNPYGKNMVIYGFEVQKGVSYEYVDWTDEFNFVNRENADFSIDIETGTTNFDGFDVSEWSGLITGLRMAGEGMKGQNAGTVDIDISTADANSFGITVRSDATFENTATGMIDIDVDQNNQSELLDGVFTLETQGIAVRDKGEFTNAGTIDIDVSSADSHVRGIWTMESGHFKNLKGGVVTINLDKPDNDPALADTNVWARGVGMGASSSFTNDGTVTITATGNKAYGLLTYASKSESSQAHFVNTGTYTFDLTGLMSGDDVVSTIGLYLGNNDIVENSGSIKGTLNSIGALAKGIEINQASTQLINTGIIDITAYSTALNETGTRAYAQGIYLNGGETFTNQGSMTLNTFVDASAATDSSQFTRGVGVLLGASSDLTSGKHAIFTNAEGATLTLHADGPINSGVQVIYGAEFVNDGTVNITLSRAEDNLTYGGDNALYIQTEGSAINNGTISISGDLKVGEKRLSGNSIINTLGTISAIALSQSDDQDQIGLVNSVDAVIDVNLSTTNVVEGLSTGQRVYGLSAASVNVTNAGMMKLDVTGNYGKVDSTFDAFAVMALSYGEANKASEELGFATTFENSGTITGTATTITEGISEDSKKGWAVGLNLHGNATFTNTGSIDLTAHSTSKAKGGSVEGSTFINDKETSFEAITDAAGSFAYALNVGKPNTQVSQTRSFVNNTENGTLTLTATALNGRAYGVYFSDGDFTNDGTITLDIDGGASRGIYLHTGDLEQAGTALNPVFVNNNLIKGTVTSNDFEQDYAAGIFMSLGEFTNNGTIDLDVIGGRIQGLGTRGGSGTKFVNAKGSTLTLDIISNNEISHASSEYISPIDGIIASGLSTFENAGTVTVNLESHLGFVKGLVSTSGGVLKNTGTITINGTAYGDYAYPEDVDPGDEWQMAYGIDLDIEDGAAGFTNEGTINIDVDSMRGYSYAAYVNGEGVFFNNASTGTLNFTVDGHEHYGYGIVLDNGATGLNEGKIEMDLRAGTTTNASVWGIATYGDSTYTNNGTIEIDGWGSENDSAAPNGIFVSQAGSEFINNGSYIFRAHRNETSVASPTDYDGIRIDNGSFINSSTGTISIDLDTPHNNGSGYAFGINMWKGDGTFQNAGQVTITLDQLADNIGIAYGYYSNQDLNTHAVGLINNAGGVITITADGESKENVWGIYSTNGIRNAGTISTNAAIYVNSIDGDGTWNLTRADTESTVIKNMIANTLNNAGILTINAADDLQNNQSLRITNINNSGTINTGSVYVAAGGQITNTGTINIVDTTDRIAMALGASASLPAAVIRNEQGANFTVDLTTTTELLGELGSVHVAGIDMYSPQNDLTRPSSQLINKGNMEVSVTGETGLMYGIVYDGGSNAVLDNQGSLTINVTKTAEDTEYSLHGLSLRTPGTYSNSGDITVNFDSSSGNSYAYGVYTTSTAAFTNSGTLTIDGKLNSLTSNGMYVGGTSTFTNTGIVDIDLTSAAQVAAGEYQPHAASITLSGGSVVNEVDGVITIDTHAAHTSGLYLNTASTFTNKGSITLNTSIQDGESTGNAVGMRVRKGSTFVNEKDASWTYTYENLDENVTTAYADAILTQSGDESSLDVVNTIRNAGTMTIKLTDMGHRQVDKYMAAFHIRAHDIFGNSGLVDIDVATNTSDNPSDLLMNLGGTFTNTGVLTVDLTTNVADQRLFSLYNEGKVVNASDITLTATNNGGGKISAISQWTKDQTLAEYTGTVENQEGANFTANLTSATGDVVFAELFGKMTLSNAGTITANLTGVNVSGIAALDAAGDDDATFANTGSLTFTLNGTGDGVLKGFEWTDSHDTMPSNSGSLTINLKGTASEAYGIYTDAADSQFSNTGSITIGADDTLDNVIAIDWVGSIANSGKIDAAGSVDVGTMTGTGNLSVTKGTLTAGSLTQNSVTLGAGVSGTVTASADLDHLSGAADSSFTIADTTSVADLGDISGFKGSLSNAGASSQASGDYDLASLGNTGNLMLSGSGAIDNLNNTGTLSVQDIALAGGSNSGTLTAGNVTMDGAFANTGDMTAAGGITFENGSSITQTEGSLTTDAGTVIGSAGHNETDGLNVIGIGAMAPEDIKAVTTELFKIFVEGTIAQDLIDHATFEGGKVIVNLGDTTLTTTQAEALKSAFNKIWGGAELEFIGTVEGNSDSTVFNQETVAKLQAQVAALKDVIYVDRNLQGENGAVTIGSSAGISDSVGFAGIDNATSITVMGGKKLVLIGGEKQADSADYVMVSNDTTTTVRAGSTLQLGSLGLKTDYAGSMGTVDFSGSDMAAATLAVVNGSYSVGAVTGSNGNVTVGAGSDFTAASMSLETSEITNSGTMTVAGDMTLTGGSLTNNNRMTVSGDLDVSGVLTNNGGAFLETNNLNVTGQLSNYGEIEAMDTSTVFGTLENQGEIRLYDTEIGNRGEIHNTATLTQTGTTEVNGLLSNVAGATANFETVNLDGANAVLENTGTITIDKLVVSNGATAVNGILTSTYSLLSTRAPAARENVGDLEVQNGQSKTNAAEGYYGAATIAGSFINTATGNSVFGVSDQWADGTGAVIESTGLVSNAGSITFSGALSNAGTINGSGTITMANADGAANTFTNSGTIDVGNMVADGINFTQTDGSFKSDTGWFANSTVNLDKGTMKHDTLGVGNTYNVGSASNASDADAILDVGTVTSDSVVNINEGGTLAADVINLTKEEKTIHLVGGTLQTNLDQIFEGLSNVAIDIDAEDTSDLVNTNIVTGVGDIKDSVAAGIEFGWGTVAFNDAFYATTAAADVLTKLEANDETDYGDGKDLEVVFNGNADVKLTVDVAKIITAQHPEGGVAYATFATELLHNESTDKPDATTLIVGTGDSSQDSIQPADPDAANVIGSMGFKGIRGATDGVWVNSDAHLVLVGSKDQADFDLADGTITVAAGYSAGNAGGARTPILTLGSYGSADRTMGHLEYVIAGVRDATSTSHTRGEVQVRNGTFTITKADIGGVLSVGGNGTDRPEDHTAELTVDELTLVGTGTVQNDAVLSIGSVTQRTLTGNGTIRNRGTLTITNGEIFSINNEAEGNLTATNLTILSRGSTNYGSVTAENLTIGGEYRWGVGGDDGLGVRTSGVWADAGTTNVTGTLTVAGLYHLYDGSLTAANLDLTGTGSLALDVNEVTQAPAGTAQIETLNAADGTTVAVNSGKVIVTDKATLEGSVSTAGEGSITIHDMDLQTGATIVNDGSLTVETDTSIAGSITGSGKANFAGLTITDGAEVAMTGEAVIDAGAVVVNENGTFTNTGSTTVESLAATNANDIVLGSLTSAGNVTLTGTNMTAALASAQNLSVTGGNLDATSAQTSAVEQNLTLADGSHSFSDLTVTGSAALTNSVFTADNLTVGGKTDISGGSVTVDDNMALTGKLTAQNTTIDAATLTVKSDAELTNTALLGSVSVDGSLSMTEGSFEGSLVKAGATTIDSVNDFVSTGASNLASLDADDSTLVFGELTVEGLTDITGGSLAADKLTAGQIAATDTTIDIAGAVSATGNSVLTGTDFDAESFTSEGNLTVSGGTFDAALVKAGDVIANNGAQITSTGASSIASLDADGATLTFGDVTVTGKADVTDGSFAADSLSAGLLAGTDTTIDIEGAVSVAGGSTLTNTDFDAATFTSDSTLTVTGGTFDAALVKAGDVTATNGAQLTSTGASTIASLTSNASTVSFGELTVNGAASATGGSIAANTLSAGDLTGLDTLITVTGAATIASLDADNSTLNLGSADVEGLADVTGGSLTTTGNFAAGSITASGTQLTIGGDLTSEGAATLTNTATNAQNVATGDLTVTGGSLTAASITGGNTTVSGGAVVTSAGTNALDKLTASGSEMTMGATTIAGDMELTGGSYAFDSLAVAGNADITDVTGTVTKGDSSFGTMTVDGTSNAAFTGTTAIADALTNAASVTFGTLNITGAAASVTNTGSITADAVSGSGVVYTQTAGSLSMASNGLSDSTLTVTGGTVKTDTLGVGNTWTLGTASTDNASIRDGSDVVMEVGNLTSESIVSINTGANLVAENINLDGTADTVTLAGGTLTTMLDQIFDDVSKSAIDIGAGEPGDVVEVEGLDAVTSVGGIKDTVSSGIAFNEGTVAFNDKTYSLSLASDVLTKLEADDAGDLEVLFNGSAAVAELTVDIANGITAKDPDTGSTAYAVFAGETLINKDAAQPDAAYTKLVVGSADPAITDAHNLVSSMGFMNVTGVQDGLFIRGEGTEFVLVGADDTMPGIDADNLMLADGAIDVGEGAAMTFGSYGKAAGTKGKFTTVSVDGTLHAKNGTFTGESVTGSGTVQIGDADKVQEAQLIVNTVELTGGALTVAAHGTLPLRNQ